MKHEFILLTFAGVFFAGLLFLIVVIYKPIIFLGNQTSQPKAISTDSSMPTTQQDKIDWLTAKLDALSQKQIADVANLQNAVSSRSAQPTQAAGKTIFDTAYTQGSTFTTSSNSYTPMGMYVNVRCPAGCVLYINFYTSSKNQGTPASATGYYNTYDIFIDGGDQNIFSQASYSAANAAVPVALSAGISVAAGTHTIDIQAKTNGGTLESDSSALTVMAVAK